MSANKSFVKLLVGPAIVTAVLLLIPLIGMQYSSDVNWSPIDFIVAGILLFGTGSVYQLITSKGSNIAYKIAAAIACASGLFLIWANLAVGIVGSEDNPVNLVYFGMILIGLIVAVAVNFRANSMPYIMFGLAGVQALTAIIVLINAGMNDAEFTFKEVVVFIGIHGFFIVQFVVSGLLFHHAAEGGATKNAKSKQ